jgi:hypothetical protein
VTPEKPKNIEELKQLIDNHEIEILDVFDLSDGTTCVAICDHRRSYEEGEIYEIHI